MLKTLIRNLIILSRLPIQAKTPDLERADDGGAGTAADKLAYTIERWLEVGKRPMRLRPFTPPTEADREFLLAVGRFVKAYQAGPKVTVDTSGGKKTLAEVLAAKAADQSSESRP